MKKSIGMAFISSAFLLFSCNSNDKTSTTMSDSTTVMQDTTSAMNNSGATVSTDTSNMTKAQPVTDKDVMDFVKKAATAGMAEVEMGNMAANSATHQRVKDYGSMLVKDHSMAGSELKSMATANNIPVPTEVTADQKAGMEKLMNKKGNDFDKAYMDMMVKDHKKVIDEFKKASNDLNDASYKGFAAKTLPVLQKHLDSAMAIQKAL